MTKYAIIVAGGTGSRMGVETPKQFLLLAGKPLLMHSIEAFHSFDPNLHIIVSLHLDYIETWQQLCKDHSFAISHQIVPGGETRFHSVLNALSSILEEGLVAVHDAARPVISVDLISKAFSEAAIHGSAIPAIPVNETVRSINNGIIKLEDRNNLRIIQTPQTFKIELLKKAYKQEYQPEFTDDASLLEAMGMKIHLIPGNARNIKITLPGDLQIAELLIGQDNINHE
jgi:2-C-methyl-D-erythritol 4-phosphate cytidylyltransferase